jgi:hypothetical protein
MSVLLKKVFSKSDVDKSIDKAEKNKKNKDLLSVILKEWKDNLTGDIDAIYKEVSTDKKIMTKNQTIEFVEKTKLILKPDITFS